MKNFAVIGLGQFGSSIARALCSKGQHVIGIDDKEEHVEEIKNNITLAVQLDATDEKALKSIGINKDIDLAIVSVGQNMEASIFITILLKEIGIRNIVAKAVSDLHAKVLKKIGVNKIVFPERDMAIQMAEHLISPNILEHIELSENYGILEVLPPKDFINHSIKDLAIRTSFGVNIIGIKKKIPDIDDNGETIIQEEMEINPLPEYKISQEDTLIVVGKNSDLKKFKTEQHN